jgi:hypothetical protein
LAHALRCLLVASGLLGLSILVPTYLVLLLDWDLRDLVILERAAKHLAIVRLLANLLIAATLLLRLLNAVILCKARLLSAFALLLLFFEWIRV